MARKKTHRIRCTEEEFNEFKNLNIEYKKKFGFPFILAVKKKGKIEILDNFRKRILSCDNVLVHSIVETSFYLYTSRLTQKWNRDIFC